MNLAATTKWLLLANTLGRSSTQYYNEGTQEQVGGSRILGEILPRQTDVAVPTVSSYRNPYRFDTADKSSTIRMMINPCGSNGTHGGLGGRALGYDCCNGGFGRGEYGIPINDEVRALQISPGQFLAHHDEVFHNIKLVNEIGEKIPRELVSRPNDETIFDESCRGLRKPHLSCYADRLRAVKSKTIAPCSDNNQTVDATLSCSSSDGKRLPHCMQVGFSSSAFVPVCGGDYAEDDECGSWIEIHRLNGTPYSNETTPLAEVKITQADATSMLVTTMPLTYRGQPNRVLCNYQEVKAREGTMVRIARHSPICCCPPRFGERSQQGSYFCPQAPNGRFGPFAPAPKNVIEAIDSESLAASYPFACNRDGGDVLMFSRRARSPEFGGRHYSYPCSNTTLGEDGMYGSPELSGRYGDSCSIGSSFTACANAPQDREGCLKNDEEFSFQGKIGKIVRVIIDERNPSTKRYAVTFNDGRSFYEFADHEIEVINTGNSFELWFVLRNRFERIVKTRKSFRIFWPHCSFEGANDRYSPFAQLDDR